MAEKLRRDQLPATPNQLRLIAILTSQMHIREPRVESDAEAGILIRELYRERRARKHVRQTN